MRRVDPVFVGVAVNRLEFAIYYPARRIPARVVGLAENLNDLAVVGLRQVVRNQGPVRTPSIAADLKAALGAGARQFLNERPAVVTVAAPDVVRQDEASVSLHADVSINVSARPHWLAQSLAGALLASEKRPQLIDAHVLNRDVGNGIIHAEPAPLAHDQQQVENRVFVHSGEASDGANAQPLAQHRNHLG